MRLFDFDTLVMPARTIRGKSVGIDTLLDQEPSLFERNSALVDRFKRNLWH